MLNIDLKDYFQSFNFGRVRGFFIKNNNFNLDQSIATVIAQIACYKNALPQGSPCSPVITNLITHSLDIRLATLAKKYSCTYSRYADDITLSTRENSFPCKIMKEESGIYTPGKSLLEIITKAGFTINTGKSRIQYKDSRQDATGLVINKKINTKSEYWRTVKSQCNSLFHTGLFLKKESEGYIDGNINTLEGQLNFIDQVDHHNRLTKQTNINPVYQIAKHNIKTSEYHSGREKTFSKFLYYKNFYGNEIPTIVCEGKTDNIYFKSAINMLVKSYPALASKDAKSNEYKLKVSFLNYTKRTRFLLELYGGTSYLNFFITKFESHYDFYKAPKPKHPIIIILDNDKGAKDIISNISKLPSVVAFPKKHNKKKDYLQSNFIHVMHNLYIVFTPRIHGTDTEIEDLFDAKTRSIKVGGKSFNPKKDFNKLSEYSKEIFANKVIKIEKSNIDFAGFKPILDRIDSAIKHYETEV